MRMSLLSAAVVLLSIALAPLPASAGGAHDDAAAEAAHKEHLRHFSLMNMLISPETETAIKASVVGGTSLDTTLVDGDSFVQTKHLTHVFWAFISFVLVLLLSFIARRKLDKDPDAGVLPSRKMGPLLFFELAIGGTWNLMRGMLGDTEARRYFPIVGTLAVYIFIMNCLALLPFGSPATDNLNTNAGMALVIFFATHYAGLRTQGPVHYAKHFMGPVLALAPLMIVIEIVGHLVRPVSLSLRLMGNMTGDHNVLFEFAYFKIPLVPLPVMALGLLVCVVQTLVFVILSTVYLSMATASSDHGEEAHGH